MWIWAPSCKFTLFCRDATFVAHLRTFKCKFSGLKLWFCKKSDKYEVWSLHRQIKWSWCHVMKGKISGISFSLERHPLRCPNDFTKESGEWGVTSQQAELVMGRGYHMLSRLVTTQFLKFCNDKIGLCPARHPDYSTADKEKNEKW